MTVGAAAGVIISGAELYRYSIRFKDPVKLGDTTLHSRKGALIRLTSPDGSEGWGETAPLPNFSPESLDDAINQLRAVAPAIANQHVIPQHLTADTYPFLPDRGLVPSAHFGLELALLNLMTCAREGLPTALFSGLSYETVSINGLLSGSKNGVLADAGFMRRAGYRAVKLKVGRRSVPEDAKVVGAVADILGGGVSLRLDANRAWGFDEALDFGRRVSGVGIAYVEEPLAEPGRLPELGRVWDLPVAFDESLVGMDPEDLEGHRYVRAIVLKPTSLGGISRVLRFMEKAKSLGMRAVVSSSYEAGVGTGALVALAAAGEEPAGLDTYRRLGEDVIEDRLPLPAPVVNVRETIEATRKVDLDRLEPIPL